MSNSFFNSEQNDSFHELKGIDLQDLLVETENLLLNYRDVLNIPNSVQFGVEIEYEKVNKKMVDRFIMNNLSDWVSKTDASLHSGGEVTSPIMHDCSNDWMALQEICQFLDRKGADTNHRAGGHIHIDSHILDNNVDAWRVFLKLYMNYEGVLFRFLYGDKINARPALVQYAPPFAEIIHEELREIEEIDRASELHFILSQNSKYHALYLGHVVYSTHHDYPKNTIEFRSPNASTNEVIWQNNINALTKMLLSAKKQLVSEEFLDYKTDNEYVSYNDNSLLYSAVNLKDVLEFVDLIFDNNIDKIYFLRQYIKNFQENHNEGKRAINAKSFVKRRNR